MLSILRLAVLLVLWWMEIQNRDMAIDTYLNLFDGEFL